MNNFLISINKAVNGIFPSVLTILHTMIFCVMSLSMCFSQLIEKDLISNGGELIANNNLSLQWSIGEITISNYSNQDISIEEGFHAGKTEDSSTSTTEIQFNEILVWPNPTSDMVYLNIENQSNELPLLVINMEGRIILRKNQKISQPISFKEFPGGIYTLVILTAKEKYNISKIIKN